jgi:hypothetical protein
MAPQRVPQQPEARRRVPACQPAIKFVPVIIVLLLANAALLSVPHVVLAMPGGASVPGSSSVHTAVGANATAVPVTIIVVAARVYTVTGGAHATATPATVVDATPLTHKLHNVKPVTIHAPPVAPVPAAALEAAAASRSGGKVDRRIRRHYRHRPGRTAAAPMDRAAARGRTLMVLASLYATLLLGMAAVETAAMKG